MSMRNHQIRVEAEVSAWMDPDYSMRSIQLSEKAGFDAVWLGDHFLPWQHSFKYAFFVWTTMAAAAARTKKIPIGVSVTTPIGGRYHPAIIAQAVGTMDSTWPGRFKIGVGTGEAVNEKPFMGRWPGWDERMGRLIEGLELMRRLWTSRSYFDFSGKYFNMENAFLYVKPKKKVEIYFSAIGEKAASYAGRYGDHLYSLNTLERCRDVIFPAFENGAEAAHRDKTKMEKVAVVGGGLVDLRGTIRNIRRFNIGAAKIENFSKSDPIAIEESGRDVPNDWIFEHYYLCERASDLIEVIDEFRKIGTDAFVFADLSPDPYASIELFSRKIIPYFKHK
jgi:coenzyme F420-dependent glucose-6-phosphate dehydrogenase